MSTASKGNCLNRQTDRQTDRHTHTHIYIYTYIYTSATPIVISPKPANLPAMMNMDPVKTATLIEMDMQNKVPLPEQSQKNINTEDLDKLAKTQQNTEEKEEKQLDQAGVSQEVQVQSLTEPNYLLQM